MPQPNMKQMLKQVQKMQEDMMAAQEQLKDEVVEASRRRRDGHRDGHRRPRAQGDQDRPRGDRSRGRELLQDMVLAAVNEALRSAQELPPQDGRRSPAASTSAPSGLPGSGCPSRACTPRPSSGSITELGKLPGIGSAPRSASPSTSCAPRGGRARARRRDPRGQGAHRPVRDLLQPRRRAALPHLPGRAARPRGHLRRRGARRRDPDRAHARVPRPSTTCSAARCRRSTASTPRT